MKEFSGFLLLVVLLWIIICLLTNIEASLERLENVAKAPPCTTSSTLRIDNRHENQLQRMEGIQ